MVKADGVAGSDEPPPELAALLRGVAPGLPLFPVPWHRDDPDFMRLQAYVVEQRDAILRHEPGARLGADPENLHQLRVASRRLRAALRTGSRLVDPEWQVSLRDELRRLGRVTAPLRDLDVLLEWLVSECERLPLGDRDPAQTLLAELRDERERRHSELVQALDGPGARVLGALESPVPSAPRAARQRLRVRVAADLQRLVDDVRHAGRAPQDAELHRLRLTVKRVRYSVELAGAPRSGGASRLLDAARQLQDALGTYQDTVAAEHRLRALAAHSRNGSVAFAAGALAERRRRARRRVAAELPHAWKQLHLAARRFGG